MSRKTRPPERLAGPVPGSAKHLVAWRLLRPLEHLLHTLRRPDEHGHRTIFADHLWVAHRVAFFSPALKSLRRIEDVFDHPGARRKYGLPRLPHSTVSDAQALFDPALLMPLIADLRSRVGVGPHEARLDELLRKRLATDGTFFTLAPRVLWALYAKPNGTARQPRKQNQHGHVRVDVQFNVLAGVPETAVVSAGRTPEYRTLVENLQCDAFYVLDRAYPSYQMMADIRAAGSDFLVRLRSDRQFTVVAEEPLSAVDWAAGVRRCQTVRAGGLRGEKALGDTPLRLVELAGADGSTVRRLTNRLDLSPELLGLVYRHRWPLTRRGPRSGLARGASRGLCPRAACQGFVRWLKCLVNFRHFFAESENGVAWPLTCGGELRSPACGCDAQRRPHVKGWWPCSGRCCWRWPPGRGPTRTTGP